MLDVSQPTAPLAQAVFGRDVGKPPLSPRPATRARHPHSPTPRADATVKTHVITRPPSTGHTRAAANTIFVCDEESHFYSQCLEGFLLAHQPAPQSVVEFGSGDGSPVVRCLSKANFGGKIHGFELCERAATLAGEHAASMNLQQQYQIHNMDFFEGILDLAPDCLIANPPYIPAPDSNIRMPSLHGGLDGANLTRDLMSLGFSNAVLMLSSYSNPVKTLQHAQTQGYHVTDYMVKPMPFGYYSSEPKVMAWLQGMKARGEAFCANNSYLLAGVLLQKQHACTRAQTDTMNGHALPELAPTLQDGIMTWASKDVGAITLPGAHTSLDQTKELLQILTCLR